MNQRIGYARVSTDDQHLDLQRDALQQAGCSVIYEEAASGKSAARPELEQCRKALRAGDTLVVWRLDRLGRSLHDLVQIVAELEQRGVHFEVCDPENDPRFKDYWQAYHALMGREGVSPEAAKAAVRRSNTLISSLMVKRGEADAMLCGLVGRYDQHLDHIRTVIGQRPDARTMAAMNAVMLPEHTLFIADTFVNDDPTAEQLAGIAQMAVAEVLRPCPRRR